MYRIVLFLACVYAVYASNIDCNTIPTPWTYCVNGSTPYARKVCRECYNTLNSAVPNTAQKAMVEYYSYVNVLGGLNMTAYELSRAIFDNAIVTYVPAFGIQFSGLEPNVAYLYLGAWQVTDQYQILNITSIKLTQEYLNVAATQRICFRNAQTNFAFCYVQQLDFEFDEVSRKISYIEIHPDTLAIVSNLPQCTAVTVEEFCTREAIVCTGSYQQYANVTACIDFMTSIPQGSPFQLATGYTQICRMFHQNLAATHPAEHCPHTGPQVINPIVTPCM